jgi:hypothetical protein
MVYTQYCFILLINTNNVEGYWSRSTNYLNCDVHILVSKYISTCASNRYNKDIRAKIFDYARGNPSRRQKNLKFK